MSWILYFNFYETWKATKLGCLVRLLVADNNGQVINADSERQLE